MKHSHQLFRHGVLFMLVYQLSPANAFAQWSGDPTINTVICGATNDQYGHVAVSDGAGGAIIVWVDLRSGTDLDLYCQRVDSLGILRWDTAGAPISTAASHQFKPAIVSDGTGGAIITWEDRRSGSDDIYAQRINGSGTVQWTGNGVPISTAADLQYEPVIASDGAGGAIIAWEDSRAFANLGDIYAQRINTSGAVQWALNGVRVMAGASTQWHQVIHSDGAGGAFVVWEDGRNDVGNIYAQRVNASGVVQWDTNGVAITTAVNGQVFPRIVSDGAAGVIIAWEDSRGGITDIYAQRINASGFVQWAANGAAVSTAANRQEAPCIIADGAGGAILAWKDERDFPPDTANIYAQRINSSGVPQWTPSGVPISTEITNQITPAIMGDGAGGAFIAWTTQGFGSFLANHRVLAQRVNAGGTVQWTTDGVLISLRFGVQFPSITNHAGGGAIIACYAATGSYDIFAQQVSPTGTLGQITEVLEESPLPSTFLLDQNYPNPFNPATAIIFSLPSQSFVSLKVFDELGREVAALLSEELPAGTYSQQWNASGLASGVYFYRLQAGSFAETKKLLLLR